jgi:hypothetical protein
MYPIVIQIHQYISWLILAVALFAVIRSWSGMIFRKQWTSTDKTTGMLFTLFIDLQLVFGIILYAALSPVTKQAFSDFSAVMKEPSVRFFALEHILVMLLALLLIHVGRSKARKAQFAAYKHRISAFYYSIATALILFRIPWDRIFSL